MVTAEIELKNPSKPKLKALVVQALVDTGAMTICIPEDMDLVIEPSGRTITVNPKSPNMPSAVVK